VNGKRRKREEREERREKREKGGGMSGTRVVFLT
jgi:hypothetical protein